MSEQGIQNGNSQQQSPESEPVPTTKEQLIDMLKKQLEAVEDEISSMQETLESEKDKRKQLSAELQEKEEKITELLENESKTLDDKVHEGLYNTLEAANSKRAQAEAQLRQLCTLNIGLNEDIERHDGQAIQDRATITINARKLGSLAQKKIDQQRRQDTLNDKKEQVQKEVSQAKQELERIEREQKELRGHLENMKKLRLYLNKNMDGKTGNGLRPSKGRAATDNFWNDT